MPADRLIDEWPQVLIEFADRAVGEQVAVELLCPALARATADGLIAGWWFVRKTPYWKVRFRPLPGGEQWLAKLLDDLAAAGGIVGWVWGIYEPEIHSFGGAAAMDVAHDLFEHDSRHTLDYLAEPTLRVGRRELAVVLASALLRGAGQDWFEQGDVWCKVAAHRPGEPGQGHVTAHAAVARLLTADPHSGLLAAYSSWVTGIEAAGRRLHALSLTGRLTRGLRAVLSHHIIFAWNRLGLTYTEQHLLTELAREAIMGTTVDTTTDRLRNALVERLRDQGTVITAPVEAALLAVPREVFVPHVPLESAYADEPIYTKLDADGVSISAASQPTIVALQLEQLAVRSGHRVLEAGAGTGVNAAYLAHLAGEHGHVTAIDVDDDIVTGARVSLAAAGVKNVAVLLGDGAAGHPAGAPYDRIIATVGIGDLPLAWLDQLAADGRLVAPMRLRGSVSRSIAFERAGTGLCSVADAMATFMPLRDGIADDPRRMLLLTADGSVVLQVNQEQDADPGALMGVLERPRSETWTGVHFGGAESVEWLDLWLTCALDNALSRMTVTPDVVARGLVTPEFGWGSMATFSAGDLAYLTLQKRGAGRYEIGIIGHGPGGERLAARVAEEVVVWDRLFRGRAVRFEIEVGHSAASTSGLGRFVFDRPNTRLVVDWT